MTKKNENRSENPRIWGFRRLSNSKKGKRQGSTRFQTKSFARRGARGRGNRSWGGVKHGGLDEARLKASKTAKKGDEMTWRPV